MRKNNCGFSSIDELLSFMKENNVFKFKILPGEELIEFSGDFGAILEVKRNVGKFSEDEASEYVAGIKSIRAINESKHFPYVFNPSNSGSLFSEDLEGVDKRVRPNYLETRGVVRK